MFYLSKQTNGTDVTFKAKVHSLWLQKSQVWIDHNNILGQLITLWVVCREAMLYLFILLKNSALLEKFSFVIWKVACSEYFRSKIYSLIHAGFIHNEQSMRCRFTISHYYFLSLLFAPQTEKLAKSVWMSLSMRLRWEGPLYIMYQNKIQIVAFKLIKYT